jgi:phosphinothricin acetyltransferase
VERPGDERERAPLVVRDGRVQDAAACLAVYAPYVRDTAITFETSLPSREDMEGRIARALADFAWLVLVDEDRLVGYAFAHAIGDKGAYAHSCETSIYLSPAASGRGGGRRLYTALLTRLAGRGFVRVLAGYTEPNEPSARLHRSLGFTDAGTFRQIGWKLGQWHDVHWMQNTLAARGLGDPDQPQEPDEPAPRKSPSRRASSAGASSAR